MNAFTLNEARILQPSLVKARLRAGTSNLAQFRLPALLSFQELFMPSLQGEFRRTCARHGNFNGLSMELLVFRTFERF